MRSLLRRGQQNRTTLKVADLRLDTISRKATRTGVPIELTPREFSLLEHLMRNPHKLLTRQQLAREIWGFTFDPGTNIVDVYINHLRKKIDQGFKQRLLHTMRGKGYYLSDRELKKIKK
jgi:DNA-binding response OmpR family regulator